MDALTNYIDFCIDNNLHTKIKGETASHHILPRAKTLPFKEYEDLKMCPWNKTELSYYNHYYAHYLLTIAVDHIAILHSFSCMHTRDSKLGRITNLIDTDVFTELWKKRNKKISQRRLEMITVGGHIMSRASYANKNNITPKRRQQMSELMSGKKNMVHKDGVLEKIRQTKSTTFINDKNLDTISAEKAAETMKNPIVTDDGQQTTIYKQSAIKHSETLNKVIIDANGNETSLSQIYAKERSERMRKNSKKYILRNVFDDRVCQELIAPEIRNISPGLEKCNKDNYLGKSKFGQTMLTKKGKANLIGLFVEKLE
jgi:hypothetical protein